MMTEIHMSSQLGTAEILSRATSSFSKIISDYTTAKAMVQDFQTLDDQGTTGADYHLLGSVCRPGVAHQDGRVPADHISG